MNSSTVHLTIVTIYCYGTPSSCGQGLPSSGLKIEMPLIIKLFLNFTIICNSWVISAYHVLEGQAKSDFKIHLVCHFS